MRMRNLLYCTGRSLLNFNDSSEGGVGLETGDQQDSLFRIS